MHLYWVGLVADLWRQGDTSLEWILTEAAKGEVFAAGHAETGNHLPALYSELGKYFNLEKNGKVGTIEPEVGSRSL